MPVPWAKNLRADPGAGRQWAVHPAQVSLGSFHPAFTDGRQAALLESQAMTVGVEQGKVAVTGVRHEQGLEKAHGCVPGVLHA